MFGFHRKKKFVSGRIQGRLMTRIGLYWILYHVVLWNALFVFRYVDYRVSGEMAVSPTPFRTMYGEFVIDYYPVILCAVIALPIVVVDMLQMTHRIAGPLVRFQNAIRDLTAGKPVKRIKLRKGDLLTEFQDEFNAYLDTVQAARTDAGDHEPGNGAPMSESDAETVAQVTAPGCNAGDSCDSKEPDGAAQPSATA